jgi:hypothetical protein
LSILTFPSIPARIAIGPCRPSAVASRFEALRGSALTRLVGRDEEIELLLRRWARAKSGDGQVVLISGEPGIGKSRLTAALEEHLHGQPHIRLRYFCSPYYQDSALYGVILGLVLGITLTARGITTSGHDQGYNQRSSDDPETVARPPRP